MEERITYIHQHFQLPEEGGGMRGWEFTRRLAEDGYEVSVICGRPKEDSCIRDGVKIIGVGTPYSNKMSMSRRAFSFMQFTLSSTLVALKTPADTVFATSTPLTVAIPGILASLVKRVPFIFEVRDLWPSIPIELGYLKNPLIIWCARLLETVAYKHADRVIALSPGMRDGVLDVSPRTEVKVIPNAADIEVFDVALSKRTETRDLLGWNSKPVVLYAGSFGEIYNIPWLVELAAETAEHVDFQIIGSGKSEDLSHKLAKERGLDSGRLLPGKMSKPEVANRVAAADFCISSVLNETSLEAASINKVFDAMAAGRPLLFNHDGWLSQMCVESGAGWRLPNDISEAGKVIRSILSDPEELSRASRKSRELAENFDRKFLYLDFKKALVG